MRAKRPRSPLSIKERTGAVGNVAGELTSPRNSLLAEIGTLSEV